MTVSTADHGKSGRVTALHALGVLDSPREERYDRVVRLARDIFGVKAAAVNLVDANRQFTKAEIGLDGQVNTACEDSMCLFTVEADAALTVEDATVDSRFKDHSFATGEKGWRFYAGHPLHAPGGEPVGALCLVDDRPRQLTGRERRLLAGMAGWVESELARQAELDQAAEVQQILMPHATLDVPGWQAAGRSVPARDIGGDFYSWHLLENGELQLHVADVMGKGLPAALLAASFRATLMGAAQFNDQPRTIERTAIATEQLLEDARAFVTVFSARVDLRSGALDYVDAGHGLAFVLGDDGYRRLNLSGPPMGTVPGFPWRLHSTTLAPGETLVVISDGYLDFYPTLEEPLALVREAELHRLGAAELVDRLTRFARGQGHEDDITALALSRDPHA